MSWVRLSKEIPSTENRGGADQLKTIGGYFGLHSLEEGLALVLVQQLVLGGIGIPGDVLVSCIVVVRAPMNVHSSQRRHRKDSDQKERQEMHSRSRGTGEEKEKGRPSRARGRNVKR